MRSFECSPESGRSAFEGCASASIEALPDRVASSSDPVGIDGSAHPRSWSCCRKPAPRTPLSTRMSVISEIVARCSDVSFDDFFGRPERDRFTPWRYKSEGKVVIITRRQFLFSAPAIFGGASMRAPRSCKHVSSL